MWVLPKFSIPLPIFKTHRDKNIRHTQTQQHEKDDLHRDNRGLEGGEERTTTDNRVGFDSKEKNEFRLVFLSNPTPDLIPTRTQK